MRIIRRFMLALALVLVSLSPAKVLADDTFTLDDIEIGKNDIIILYTNDVHGGVSNFASMHGTTENCLGYAGLAAVKEDAASRAGYVLVTDSGDSIQGSVMDTMSDGQASIDLMEKIPYDVAVPGNHEFDFYVQPFLEKAKAASFEYVCANFTDMEGNLLLPKAYTTRSATVNGKEVKIAFIGLDTPGSIASGKPVQFQDDNGNWKYTFNAETDEQFYDLVQKTVDEARAEIGQDGIVIVLGHLGDATEKEGWLSQAVIANTNGIDVFFDGHAHSVIQMDLLPNKDDETVIRTSTGTKLNNIGVLKISVKEDGSYEFASQLINALTEKEKNSDEYKRMDVEVKAVEDQYAYLVELLAVSDYPLMIYDPETGNRIVRNHECNMGDLLADAYLWYSSHPVDAVKDKMVPADCAMLNGGSIRANIESERINYLDVLTVFPWYTHVTEIKATGQQIVDCLEMGVIDYPNQSGGFMQVSGITYRIDETKPSKVVTDDKMMFVKVDGSYEKGDYRVSHVKIGGKPVDLKKEYVLMLNQYYYQELGDGMTMFKDCEAYVVNEDNVIDVEVVAKYINEGLDGVIPEKYANVYGEGRITTNADPLPEDDAPAGVWAPVVILSVLFAVGVAMAVVVSQIIKAKKEDEGIE